MDWLGVTEVVALVLVVALLVPLVSLYTHAVAGWPGRVGCSTVHCACSTKA